MFLLNACEIKIMNLSVLVSVDAAEQTRYEKSSLVPPSVSMKRIITDNGGEELRGRAARCHEGRSGHVLAEMEALQKENNVFNLS